MNSNYVAVFLVFLVLALSTVSISFMLSSVFDSTRNAAIVGTLVYFGSVFVVILYPDNVQPSLLVIPGCFFPIVFIYFASGVISQLEISTVGLQFSKLGVVIDGHSMLDCLAGGLLGILIHLLLIIYFE